MIRPAQLADLVQIPRGGAVVLVAASKGFSPWQGFDAGASSCLIERADAYGLRARLITACRERGLLTEENFLTAAGRKALAAWEARNG